MQMNMNYTNVLTNDANNSFVLFANHLYYSHVFVDLHRINGLNKTHNF